LNEPDDLDEDEQKIILAMFILGKGKIGVDINESDIFGLCDSMTLEELKRNAMRFKPENLGSDLLDV
jgi:hypothetical protein